MDRKPSGDTKVRKDDTADASVVNNKPRLLTKPAKVPMWTKDLTLETYTQEIQTWSDVLEEIPEHVKYADLVESFKTNKEIKGLQKYVGEHILPVLEVVEEQTIKKVLEILTLKYGRTRVEMVEDFIEIGQNLKMTIMRMMLSYFWERKNSFREEKN